MSITRVTVQMVGIKTTFAVASGLPASALELEEGQESNVENDDALNTLRVLPNVGTGNRLLFDALVSTAQANKSTVQAGCKWLKVQVAHVK